MDRFAAFTRRNALNISLVLVALTVCSVVWVVILLGDQARTNCQGIQKLNAAISLVVQDNNKTLGAKGSAGYAYYRTHPEELAAAKKAGDLELIVFKPHHC